MSKKSKEEFGKIVYFDEQAAMDLIELEKEGMESIVTKKLRETVAQVEAGSSVNKGFFNLVKLKLSGNASHQRNNIIETQITSTLISSFIDIIKNNDQVIKLENLKLTISKDSAAYYRNLVPVLHMIDDINKLSSLSDEDKDNFSGINIKGIGNALDSLSGYYDFTCISTDGEQKIIRFNIAGLRNNYNLNDLTKMNLKLFGIKVGEIEDINLDFKDQIENMTNQNNTRSMGLDFDAEKAEKSTYDIIDVVLAGV
ncbi:nitrogen fixation protein NifU [Oceanobacillus picturae]|uniref:Nitrogen fixation protein NifU n=1 Tax=Oceanobacillus picturae TaxID=171693 RepID=A0A0U9HBA5_9BACI|nr:DUF6414 family protein [Oceanobacillus picturae]GAQ19874.1 nitrogen fixation protein NifU [Oceanobacillus picturae]